MSGNHVAAFEDNLLDSLLPGQVSQLEAQLRRGDGRARHWPEGRTARRAFRPFFGRTRHECPWTLARLRTGLSIQSWTRTRRFRHIVDNLCFGPVDGTSAFA